MEINLNQIKGYENFWGYSICNDGRLLSYWKNTNGYNRESYLVNEPTELENVLDTKGYIRNLLGGRNIYKKSIRRHTLVAKAFIPNPNNYTQVGHKNGIKTDNHVNNLYWCNNSINQRDCYKLGEKKLKYTEDQIKIMCENWTKFTKKELSKLCGINSGSMYDIYTGTSIMYKDIVSKYK
jgi:hypothetical protein